MNSKCDEYLNRAVFLAAELLDLADQGDDMREDVNCGVLYGTIRDSAYKIRAMAQAELQEHKAKKLLTKTPQIQSQQDKMSPL